MVEALVHCLLSPSTHRMHLHVFCICRFGLMHCLSTLELTTLGFFVLYTVHTFKWHLNLTHAFRQSEPEARTACVC